VPQDVLPLASGEWLAAKVKRPPALDGAPNLTLTTLSLAPPALAPFLPWDGSQAAVRKSQDKDSARILS